MEISAVNLSQEVVDAYELMDNTLLHTALSDPLCRIDTEIGDSKVVDDFLPQFKLLRWDNEVNLSIRLVHNETEPTFCCDRDKICWKGKEVEAHIYDVREYVTEFDVVLLQKPVTNLVKFTLQTKGLDLVFQPDLTAQAIAEGRERPENVIRSYVGFNVSKRGDYSRVGGKNYRTGKFCHIYRPKIFDASGKGIWGELHIDVDAGLLTVTIPQEFLDNAVYPVRQAAGLTFGYDPESTPGSSRSLGAGYWMGSLFTSPAGGGTVSDLRAYVSMANVAATGNFKGTIVQHSDLTIIDGGVGAVSEQVTDTPGWKISTLTPTIGDAVDYVLSLVCGNLSSGNFKMWYDTGAANQGHYESDNNYTTPANPSGVSHNTDECGIYVTYEAAGGSSIPGSTFKGMMLGQNRGMQRHL